MARGFVEVEWIPEPVVIARDYERMYMAWNERQGAMEESLGAVIGSTTRHFDNHGPGWEPWAEKTANDPRANDLMYRTGALMDGATSEGSYEVTNTQISWTGAAAPVYGQFHRTGTSRMPQRDFIGLDAEAEGEIVAIWESWMDSIASIGGGAPSFRSVNVGKYGSRFFGVHPVTGRKGFIPNPFA